MLVADNLHHFRGCRGGLLGDRLRRGRVTELILREQKSADDAGQRRGQDLEDELAQKTHQ